MEKIERQNLEKLLDWCNDTYAHWENVKPRFSDQFDLKSLEEWEELYDELKSKLQADLKEDFDYYQRAKDLYDQWNVFYKKTYDAEEEVELMNQT